MLLILNKALWQDNMIIAGVKEYPNGKCKGRLENILENIEEEYRWPTGQNLQQKDDQWSKK